MKIVMTFPGRYGDLLWAMPSARAVAETYDQPIDLVISPKYGSLTELLRLQPYLASVTIDPAWEVREEAPMQPRIPPTPIEADLVVHGGYKGWPQRPLPYEIWNTVAGQIDKPYSRVPDLRRVWITTSTTGLTFFDDRKDAAVTFGFSDEWFELKVGLAILVAEQESFWDVVSCCGSHRWNNEAGKGNCNWLEATDCIYQSQIFLGCCSALHVLAVGLGKPCVIVEPSEMRWNPIFWPLGMDGPQVTCVKGGDGRPTFDARHVADTLKRVLRTCTVRTGGTS